MYKRIQWRKKIRFFFFKNKVLKQLNNDIEQQPKISLTQISLFTKFNSTWVVKLHVKCRLLEENGKKST